ncbi:MAG: SPFH domain-containing protein [Phycisphaerales bacterium]|jgi:regulator of protease activity HflC (stomatin/prohibitin superfamily)|nr:SPFH domain-containing protein [Phycisphaerales bacterium]
MKADHLTYRRATSVSILGLVLQAVLATVLLIYGVVAGDASSQFAARFAYLGCVVWGALVFLFDQHRRERLETAEIDALRDSAEASSVFSGEGEVRVAGRRLAFTQRVIIPIVAVVYGLALLGAGWWSLTRGRELYELDDVAGGTLRGFAIAIGLAAAFVGFVFGRYVSGMAKQAVWSPLKAGAAQMVGVALMGLAVAVGHFVDIAGPDVVRRALLVVIPGAMLVLGAEVFLNFVLEVYRPRKPGEAPRAAFESRLLGYVAAPDRIAQSIGEAINYQFGSDVAGSWFYRLVSRWKWVLFAAAVLVVWGLSALTVVQPHQRGMVLRFGRVVQDDVGPGLLVKAPWPIDRVEVPVYERRDVKGKIENRSYTATGVRTLQLGTNPSEGIGPILWTNEHAQEEFLLCQPARGASGAAGSGGSQGGGEQLRDLAMVAIEVPLHYAVRDVALYDELGTPEMRDKLLRAVGQREVMKFLSSRGVDEIIGMERAELSDEIRQRVARAFDGLNPDEHGVARGAGVEVLFVGAEGVHPPRKVAPNYERVVQAEKLREANIAIARTDAIKRLSEVVGGVDEADAVVRLLDEREASRTSDANAAELSRLDLEIQAAVERAGGEAAKLVETASAERWQKHMGERARVAMFAGQRASYEAAPLVYKAGLYFDALAEVMRDARVFLVGVDNPKIRIDAQTQQIGTDVFRRMDE